MGGNYNLIDIHRFMTGVFVDAVTVRWVLRSSSQLVAYKIATCELVPFKLNATREQSLTRVGRFVVPHPMSAHFGVDYGESDENL